MGVGQCGRHGGGTRCSAARCGVRRSIRRRIGSATLGRVTLFAAGAAGTACATEPLPLVCADIRKGELVITELRGNLGDDEATTSSTDDTSTGSDSTGGGAPQSTGAGSSEGTSASVEPPPSDRGRDWIEIRNVTDRTLDLHGLVIRNAAADGTGEVVMRVRYHRELDAGQPYVLGLSFDYERPLHIDYGIVDDDGTSSANLLESGRLELGSCDTSIDLVVYDPLPRDGTWSLGVEPPDADANNEAEAWCVDTSFAAIGDAIEPGTPGEPNRPCD